MVIDRRSREGGFTMVELTVVFIVLVILFTIIIVTTTRAREKSRVTTASTDLRQISSGIGLLTMDTGKWPNGCTPYVFSDPEGFINGANSGLISKPSVGVISNCSWTDNDVALWNGPYVQNAIDPWGRGYYFDPDYIICVGGVTKTAVAILSFGPNGAENYPGSGGAPCTVVDTDDVYFLMAVP